jgi:hypothetical protein
MSAPALQLDPLRDREWWRAEAIRTRTDWPSILRQRIKVKAWIKAGRPPLSRWMGDMAPEGGT